MMDYEPVIAVGQNVQVEIEGGIDPNEYFSVLKNEGQIITPEQLDAQLHYCAKEIIRAEKNGQTNFVKDLKFQAQVLLRERCLLEIGVTKYVQRDAVKAGIDRISPKNSVKLIELSRYSRFIPESASDKIQAIRDKEIFDDYIVVFTDLTDNDYKTPKEREFVKRNRDPICFGVFRDQQQHRVYNRMYLVADWEDEICDMTYDKFLTNLKPDDVGEIDANVVDQMGVAVREWDKPSLYDKIKVIFRRG
jgi:hypothetical protein